LVEVLLCCSTESCRDVPMMGGPKPLPPAGDKGEFHVSYWLMSLSLYIIKLLNVYICTCTAANVLCVCGLGCTSCT
jgi:hypothetical protein